MSRPHHRPYQEMRTKMKYRKKPLVVEAVQFTGIDSWAAVSAFLREADASYTLAGGWEGESVTIHTLEGKMTAHPKAVTIVAVAGKGTVVNGIHGKPARLSSLPNTMAVQHH